MEYRILTEPGDLEACIEMQKTIWGLEETGVTSPITLKALSLDAPPVGLVLGAFDSGAMVGFAIVMATMEPGVVYGHMLGVLDSYRDSKIGGKLFERVIEALKNRGIREMVCTYEPLESRNAHLYLNKFQGYAMAYEDDCFHVHSAMHDGMPLDRLLTRFPFDGSGKPNPAAAADWSHLPVAKPDNMPDGDTVLLEIPGNLAEMKKSDMERVKRYRADTRAVFMEYLNKRGYRAVALQSEVTPEGRISRYVLTRGGGA